MSRLSGAKDIDIELTPDHSVRITAKFATAYEAAIAFDEIKSAAETGLLRLKFRTGEILEESSPQPK